MSEYDFLDAFAQEEGFGLGNTMYGDFSNAIGLAGDVQGYYEHHGAESESGEYTGQEGGDAAGDEHVERTATPRERAEDEEQDKNTKSPRNEYGFSAVRGVMKSKAIDEGEKLDILKDMPEDELNKLYNQAMAANGLEPPSSSSSSSTATTAPSTTEPITEDNYRPLIPDDETPTDPNAPQPLYPAYTGSFLTTQEAKKHRQRTRVAPKSKAADVERVRRYGRPYWVRRIYESMIDISDISDGASSIHRQRFADDTTFDPLDLEAAAHHVFDSALAVHERGWNRPLVYHKRVVRGKLTDVSEKSLERRLMRICACLKQKKATVDDALRGGITLALLCDNPEARGFTKTSNNTGNKKRGERLRRAKGSETQQQAGEEAGEEEVEE